MGRTGQEEGGEEEGARGGEGVVFKLSLRFCSSMICRAMVESR